MEEKTQATLGSVLRNRYFLLLWLAQVLSQTAQNGIFYTLMVFVEERTSSSIHMSFLVLSAILPSLLLGIAAGVFVDRVPKKAILFSTNLLRALTALGFLLFHQTLALIYLLNLLFSTISQFFAPAEAAAIPMLVKRHELLAANGLFNLTFTASQLLGFVIIAPPLVKWLGAETLFILVALTYVVAALLVGSLPTDPTRTRRSNWEATAIRHEIGAELGEGWRLLRYDAAISLSMLHLTLMAALMLVMGMLAPGFVKRVLEIRADDAVFVLAPAGVGILLGTLALPLLTRSLSKEKLLNLGLFVLSISILLLGLVERAKVYPASGRSLGLPSPDVAMAVTRLVGGVMLLALVLGFSYALVSIPAQTILQERTPAGMRGRIFAVQLTFGYLASVLPLLFIGGLADLLGISPVILLLGGGFLIVAFFSLQRGAMASQPGLMER